MYLMRTGIAASRSESRASLYPHRPTEISTVPLRFIFPALAQFLKEPQEDLPLLF